MIDEHGDEWLDLGEAATALCITRRQLFTYRRRELMPSRKVGRVVYLRAANVEMLAKLMRRCGRPHKASSKVPISLLSELVEIVKGGTTAYSAALEGSEVRVSRMLRQCWPRTLLREYRSILLRLEALFSDTITYGEMWDGIRDAFGYPPSQEDFHDFLEVAQLTAELMP